MQIEQSLLPSKKLKPHYHSVDELIRDTTVGLMMRLPLEVYKVKVREEGGNRIVYILRYSVSEWVVLDSPTDYSGAGREELRKALKLEERWRKNKIPVHEFEVDYKLYWTLYSAFTNIK